MNLFDLFTQKEKTPEQMGSITPIVQDDEGKLSDNLYEQYNNSKRKAWANEATENNEFRNGVQWTPEQEEDLVADGLTPVVVNAIFPAVEATKAALTANDPSYTVTGREGSDMKLGTVIADVLSFIWQRNQGKTELRQLIDDYLVQGVGGFLAWVDPVGDNGRPEICFSAVQPKDVFIDPSSRDRYARDAAHILIANTMTAEQLQETYPQYAHLLDSLPKESVENLHGANGVGDLERGGDQMAVRYKVIDRYSRVKETKWVVYDPQSGKDFVSKNRDEVIQKQVLLEKTVAGGVQMILDELQLRQAMQYYQQFNGVFHYAVDPNDQTMTPFPMAGTEQEHNDPATQVVPGSETTLTPITIGELVRQGALELNPVISSYIKRVFSIGGRAVYSRSYPFDCHLFVPCYNRWNRTPFAEGDIPLVKQLQIYINKLRAILILHAANSAGVKLAIARGSGDVNTLKKEWRVPGTNVIEVDMEYGPPVQAAPPPLPNELYHNEGQAKEDIQQILGAYLLSQGDPSQAPDTYKGTLAVDEYGQRRIKNKKDDIEGFLTQFGTVILTLVQHYYTEPKIIRLVRPNNIGYQVKLNYIEDYSDVGAAKINDLSAGKFDVIVVSGSTLPVNRWARFEYYKQLYELGVIDRAELLKHAEVSDPEAVLSRMDELVQLRQQLEQAIAQIKNLEGDLQTARRESVHDRMKVEVMDFASKLDGLKNKAEAATTLYQQRLKDEVGNMISSAQADAESQ